MAFFLRGDEGIALYKVNDKSSEKPMKALCEACESRPATIVERCDDPVEPYSLCGACHHRLHARALRPLEWYNLSKRYGWQRFLLHDDFYDQDGTADQTKERVIASEKYPIPSFEAVRMAPETLLDWCITRWRLQELEVAAWKSIGHDEAIRSLSSRFSATRNAWIRGIVLEIIGNIADLRYADFVRYCWAEYPESVPLYSLAQATAAIFPFREGFDLVAAALAGLEPNRRRRAMYCLGYFSSPAGLDWIEANFFEPVTNDWGCLAAMCRPSWARLAAWLRSGRPLSLIAIDTLGAIARQPTPLLKRHDVRLQDAPSLSILDKALREYEQRDSVPRVSQRVAALLKDPARITKLS